MYEVVKTTEKMLKSKKMLKDKKEDVKRQQRRYRRLSHYPPGSKAPFFDIANQREVCESEFYMYINCCDLKKNCH
jgi:hypothetical protein